MSTMHNWVTRRPVFDAGGRLTAYELAHQRLPGTPADDFAGEVLLGTVAGANAADWTAGHLTLVHVTPPALWSAAVQQLDPRRVGFVLDSNLQDPDTVDRCRDLGVRGFRVGVERLLFPDPGDPMLALLSFANVNVAAYSDPQLDRLVAVCRGQRLQLVASGAERPALRRRCEQLGFQRFHGYGPPDAQAGAHPELALDHLGTFRLMRAVRDTAISEVRIAEEFQRNPALVYRLLRLVNSAAVGGRRVESIPHALALLGRRVLYRWLGLLLLEPVREANARAELTRSALVRARMCEQIAPLAGRPWAAEPLFTVGLFSRLDLLLGIPLETIVAELELGPELAESLIHRTGPDGEVLELVEAYEQGDWERLAARCAALELPGEQLVEIYAQALVWAAGQSSAAD